MRLKSTIVLALSFAVLLISGITRSGLAQTGAGPRSRTDLYQLYGEFTGKTVLRPGALPPLPLPAADAGSSTTQPDRIKQIEAVFAEANLDVIPDGNRFVWIMPAGLRNSSIMKLLEGIQRPPVRGETAGASDEAITLGVIDFINAPIEQVLAVYSDLRHRALVRPGILSPVQITLRTQTQLTRDEVNYALNVVLLFNGFAAIDDGDKFVQVVPANMAKQVRPGAPLPDEAEPLIEPAKIPRIGFMERGTPKPVAPIAATLLAVYADLTDQKPLPEGEIGGVRIMFDMHLPLRKSELLYAIRTTLALNGLKIVKEDDGVRLERIKP